MPSKTSPVPATAVMFAPGFSNYLAHEVFTSKRRGGRSWFVFGGCGCLLLLGLVVLAGYLAYATVLCALLGLVWVAQVIALLGWCLYAAGWYAAAGARKLFHGKKDGS